jgi:hypothetical protein
LQGFNDPSVGNLISNINFSSNVIFSGSNFGGSNGNSNINNFIGGGQNLGGGGQRRL